MYHTILEYNATMDKREREYNATLHYLNIFLKCIKSVSKLTLYIDKKCEVFLTSVLYCHFRINSYINSHATKVCSTAQVSFSVTKRSKLRQLSLCLLAALIRQRHNMACINLVIQNSQETMKTRNNEKLVTRFHICLVAHMCLHGSLSKLNDDLVCKPHSSCESDLTARFSEMLKIMR